MAIETLNGRWRATATCSVNSEVESLGNEGFDPNGVSNWLNGFDPALLRDATPTSGLVLAIAAADGTFTEAVTGTPHIPWFDADGVLTEDVAPFDGTVVHNAHGAYLRPTEIPKWAAPVDGRYGNAILRYDDGDTKIADSVRVIDGRLIRTVNVVTDELYLNRVIIIYERDESDE